MKYRKLPVEIEAVKVSELLGNFKHNWKELPQWVKDSYENMTINTITDTDFIVNTLEGQMKATMNDYLIKGVNNELYPCKIDIFEKTYELVEE
jgi:6-phosphogluconolactonase/glucosamine-6-phosphate isomerase/deaminase